jgi:hypothetical protein
MIFYIIPTVPDKGKTKLAPCQEVVLESGHIVTHVLKLKSRDSSVGIPPDYGVDDRGSRVRFSAGAGNFSLQHRLQNGLTPAIRAPFNHWIGG